MAVGEAIWPTIYPIEGVKLGVAQAGIRYKNRNDVLLIELAENSTAAAVFTQNAFCAAPVSVAKANLQSANPRYLVINSGNANACTGDLGERACLQTLQALSQTCGIPQAQVLPFSTGVIGEQLPTEKLVAALPQALANLDTENWRIAAESIMTTDTRPKAASRQVKLNGETIAITGIAKGAGMIRPNMATMLAYIATDASVSKTVLQHACASAANASFNRITIDGDTSTNDSCVLMATGKRQVHIDSTESAEYREFYSALEQVFQSLAQQIVRDGEGASKFVTIEVKNGRNKEECLKIAYAIAHSPLVKTALFASDPNWGRIVAAIGYADIDGLDASKIDVYLDDVQVVENGQRAAGYTEEAGQSVFSNAEFSIIVDLHRGSESELIWTTDLSHEYVTINAEYRS